MIATEFTTTRFPRREQLAAEDRWAEAAADVRRADIRLGRIVGREPWELAGEAR